MSRAVDLVDEAATAALAARLAAVVEPGEAVLLSGSLGAGKTALARAFVRSWLGEPAAEVPSPTFTLVQVYEGPRGELWHCDLYRLGGPDELLELGIEQAFARSVTLVEWPDRLGGWLPEDRLELALEICEATDRRRAVLVGHGRWAARVGDMDLEKPIGRG